MYYGPVHVQADFVGNTRSVYVLSPTDNVLQIATCNYLLSVVYRTDCSNWGPRQYNILPTYPEIKYDSENRLATCIQPAVQSDILLYPCS